MVYYLVVMHVMEWRYLVKYLSFFSICIDVYLHYDFLTLRNGFIRNYVWPR